MMKIGIIGAGAISVEHLGGYACHTECKLVAIADLNRELAQKRAEEYGIETVYTDYKELLANPEIDAVSIVTPTFTHKNIVVDALKAGKHVLCEKPPALTSDDVKECVDTAKATGKLLMYAMVCRFKDDSKYLKRYIESGKMGPILRAKASRLMRLEKLGGWLYNKEKSGGFLFDSGIHELDLALWFMGYPNPKSVLAYTSNINSERADDIHGAEMIYTAADTNKQERNLESFCGAFVTLDNGACLQVEASSMLNCIRPGISIELNGRDAGSLMYPREPGKELDIIELSEDGYFSIKQPIVDKKNAYVAEVHHFIDCCMGKTECMCDASDAIKLVKILNAIYKSAETGKAVEF